jgi:hypothetical protein
LTLRHCLLPCSVIPASVSASCVRGRRTWHHITLAGLRPPPAAPCRLRVITKRFKFTALKEKAPDAADAAAAAGGTSAGRRKAELKAAAAGVVGKRGEYGCVCRKQNAEKNGTLANLTDRLPTVQLTCLLCGQGRRRSQRQCFDCWAFSAKTGLEPLLGLSGAKPAAQSARLTTTLSQDGLAPVGAAAAAAGGCTGQTRRQPAQQQQQQRKQQGEPEKKGKAGTAGKRALEALGTTSGQKRRKTGGSAAAAKPAPAAGGRGGRKGPSSAAVSGSAADDSQVPSIHRLLHSVQHRHAADSPHPSEDRWARLPSCSWF